MINRKQFALAAAGAFALSSGAAMAQGSVGAYYADFGDLDGFGLEADFVVADQFRLFADVTMLDEGDVEQDIVRFGGGYLMQMNDQMSLEFGASFQNWDFSNPFFSFDDDAIGVHGALNYAVTPEFTFTAKAEFLMFDMMDDDDSVIGLRGSYNVTPEIAIFGGADIYNHDVIDETLIRFGASFNF